MNENQLYVRSPEDLAAALKARFKLVCLKCGSDNTVFDYEPVSMGSTLTGAYGGEISFGCNDCKQNDITMDLT